MGRIRLLENHSWAIFPELPGSTISHGSEFGDEETLQAILGNHPYFNDFKPFLSQGVDFVFTEEITKEDRVKELEANLERGNHKSAQGQEETLSKLLAKDVKTRFDVPLCRGAVQSIPGAMVQPCGITSQFTLEPDGTCVVKKRLTHDMSFGMTHDKISVNDRINMMAYEEMVLWVVVSPLLDSLHCGSQTEKPKEEDTHSEV
jgi:hypothetical protein